MRTPIDLKRGVTTFGSRGARAARLGVTSQTIWHWEHGGAITEPHRRLLRYVVEEAARA